MRHAALYAARYAKVCVFSSVNIVSMILQCRLTITFPGFTVRSASWPVSIIFSEPGFNVRTASSPSSRVSRILSVSIIFAGFNVRTDSSPVSMIFSVSIAFPGFNVLQC